MTNEYIHSTDTEPHRTIDNTSGKLMHTPIKKIDLATVDDVRLEMARTYRAMKSGGIETSDGTKLVYVLCQIAKMIELYDIENRLTLLEKEHEASSRTN
jgi:hypothetical protein